MADSSDNDLKRHEQSNLVLLHASLATALASQKPLKSILQTCCQQLVDYLDAAFVRVWLTNEAESLLILSASAGAYTHPDSNQSRISVGELKIGRIASSQNPILINDVPSNSNISDPDWAIREGMVAFAGYPLVVQHRTVGVIALFAKHELSRDVFQQLSPMADAIAQCVLRKRTERDIIERERRLNLALDAGRMGTWEWDIASDHVIWSKQLYDLFGYQQDEFVPTRSGFMNVIHPDDRESVEKRIESCFTGDCESYEMEFRVVRGDNQQIVWTSGRGMIQRDEARRPVSIVAAATDVTQRKYWELELADREAHLRRVIDNTVNFIGVLDCEGTLLEANATALLAGGVDRKDVIGKPFWDCYWWDFSRESRQRVQDAVKRAAAGEVVRYDVEVRMANDTRMAIDFMLSPIRDETGRITHLVPSGVDIQDRKKAEQLLADAKVRLDLAMGVSKVAAWGWDEVSNGPVSNPNLNRLFGFDAADTPTFQEYLGRIHEADRECVSKAIQKAIDDGAPYDEEYRVHLPSGEIKWLHARGEARYRGDGRFDEFHGVVSDITEHKLFELELADREAHLRRVINNQLGLVGVIGRNGKLLEVDDGSLRIAGVERTDVIGKHFADCAWWTYDETISLKIRQTMERAFAGETVRFDIPLFASGSGRPGQRLMIDFMLAPVRDAVGNITHLIFSGVDISDRVKAEAARKDNEERLRMALRAAGMAAWEWNPENSVWTDELFELLGISPQQTASPELLFRCVYPPDLAQLKEAWRLAINGEKDYSHEFRILRPDGEVRWIVGVGEVVRDANGKVIRIFGLNWDSTNDHLAAEALRASEQKAQLANKSKSEFVANMSHEIRTPMTAVLGYADLLLAEEHDPEKLEYLQTIQRNGKFLLGIINDILDLSKIEAGKLEITQERFSIVDLVNDVHSMMQVRATESDLSFEVDFDGQIPRVIESDAKRLRQILVNLIGNAIKFTKSGQVRLVIREVSQNGQTQIQFEVVDTGIGMTAEQQSQLFQPFSQGDASVTRSYGGTGLGLAISQRLAGMLGGKISVESKIDEGSKFAFSISAGDVSHEDRIQGGADAETQTAETADAPRQAPPQSLNCTVFIVDDRRDIRFLSSHILSGLGANVREAVDGLDAIEQLESDSEFMSSVDLILLDMQMPRLDGYQTAARLRKLGFAKPIVALTADAMQEDVNRCIEMGCDEYLSKPIDTAKLVEVAYRLTSG